MKRLLLCIGLSMVSCSPAMAFIDQGALKEAIYYAEGGAKTKHPYGVLSVKCSGKEACGRIVDNSIRNSLKRYAKQGGKADYRQFIAFFGKRWCPVGVENDKGNLNRNWIKNTLYFYELNK